jgi:hypothetical protein
MKVIELVRIQQQRTNSFAREDTEHFNIKYSSNDTTKILTTRELVTKPATTSFCIYQSAEADYQFEVGVRCSMTERGHGTTIGQ